MFRMQKIFFKIVTEAYGFLSKQDSISPYTVLEQAADRKGMAGAPIESFLEILW